MTARKVFCIVDASGNWSKMATDLTVARGGEQFAAPFVLLKSGLFWFGPSSKPEGGNVMKRTLIGLTAAVANEKGGSMSRRKPMTKFTLALAMFLGICRVTQAFSQDALFVRAPGSPVKVGPGSGGLVLADVNRDGHLGLVTQHLLQRNVAVQLGDGKGRFAPAGKSPMKLDYEPSAIAVADVNNDAILDLGIASRDRDKEYVHIYLGNNTVRFSEAAGSPLAVSASVSASGDYKPSLRLVDVNEDGKPDIVTANGRRNTIEILFGDGRGGFSGRPVLKLSGQGQYSFALQRAQSRPEPHSPKGFPTDRGERKVHTRQEVDRE